MPLIISHPKSNPKIRKIEDNISVHNHSYASCGPLQLFYQKKQGIGNKNKLLK